MTESSIGHNHVLYIYIFSDGAWLLNINIVLQYSLQSGLELMHIVVGINNVSASHTGIRQTTDKLAEIMCQPSFARKSRRLLSEVNVS